MDISVTEIRRQDEQIVITRDGKPVAQITAPPAERRIVRCEIMRGRIHIFPEALDPIDEARFPRGDV
jgi:antitoxin (DNA-binding transcriptional repressor) of toxin-antitoxin stability system